ncbi:hypothetical protein QJS10_CPA05g02301 [Acorus calamus]|uniref:Uncharacterized protein n=1 Tax=Acorus calamus TaxID=4465 RepID=A0AAV9EW79_ACOCL|nr:hypothetical protein QJS10_CPA05g02301 [Acorus calamus]
MSTPIHSEVSLRTPGSRHGFNWFPPQYTCGSHNADSLFPKDKKGQGNYFAATCHTWLHQVILRGTISKCKPTPRSPIPLVTVVNDGRQKFRRVYQPRSAFLLATVLKRGCPKYQPAPVIKAVAAPSMVSLAKENMRCPMPNHCKRPLSSHKEIENPFSKSEKDSLPCLIGCWRILFGLGIRRFE